MRRASGFRECFGPTLYTDVSVFFFLYIYIYTVNVICYVETDARAFPVVCRLSRRTRCYRRKRSRRRAPRHLSVVARPAVRRRRRQYNTRAIPPICVIHVKAHGETGNGRHGIASSCGRLHVKYLCCTRKCGDTMLLR